VPKPKIERKFTQASIPAQIYLDRDLNFAEKFLWMEINALDGRDGCFARNSHFSNFMDLSERRIQHLLASLLSKKYILKFYDAGGRRVIRVNHAALDSAPPASVLWKNSKPKKAGVKKISPHEENFTGGVKKISPSRDTSERIKNSPISSLENELGTFKEQKEELDKFLKIFPKYQPSNPKLIAELVGILRETLEREGMTRHDLAKILTERRAIFDTWTKKEKNHERALKQILLNDHWKDDSFWFSRVDPAVTKANRAAQIKDDEHRQKLEAGEHRRKIKDEISEITGEFFEICRAGKFRDKKTNPKKRFEIIDFGTVGEFEEKIKSKFPNNSAEYIDVFLSMTQKLKKEAERQAA